MRVSTVIMSATVTVAVLFGSAGSASAADARPTRERVESLARYAINQARAERGLKPFSWNAKLRDVSRAHSVDMARDGELRHTVRLERKVVRSRMLGENIGVGFSMDAINAALMESAGHRRNILGAYTLAAVGATVTEYEIYITQVFVTPAR